MDDVVVCWLKIICGICFTALLCKYYEGCVIVEQYYRSVNCEAIVLHVKVVDHYVV